MEQKMEKENCSVQEEINRIAQAVNQLKAPEDLCFCMLGNSVLCDEGMAARAHMQALDELVHFDCLVHLGDILRGNNPENISRRILQQELRAYRNTLKNGRVFVVQGDQDGYRDESFCGQLVCGIMHDQLWHEETAFIDQDNAVHREGDAPYYYVDFPDSHTRMIFLCSSFCEFDAENKFFERYPAFDLRQLAWLKNQALKAEKGWNILLFSHAMPKSRFETGKNPLSLDGFSGEKFLKTLQDAQVEYGVSIVCWCAGHYLYDAEASVVCINHMTIGSLAPLLPTNIKVEEAHFDPKRQAGSVEAELWDVLLLKPSERKLYAFRIGAGKDRVLQY